MTNFTGHLKGATTAESLVAVNDVPEHCLMTRAQTSHQTCSDPHFNDTKHSSCGTADLIKGNGKQHGYFVNEHANGDREGGTYEGKVSTVNGQVSIEGTWKYTFGTGEFSGITGHGTFKGRMTSPTHGETSFEGSYQLKAGTKAA